MTYRTYNLSSFPFWLYGPVQLGQTVQLRVILDKEKDPNNEGCSGLSPNDLLALIILEKDIPVVKIIVAFFPGGRSGLGRLRLDGEPRIQEAGRRK